MLRVMPLSHIRVLMTAQHQVHQIHKQRRSPRLCALLLLGMLPMFSTGIANAQVIRCTDPATGKVSYTDGKCDSGNKVTEIEARKSPEEIRAEREQAAQAQERARERQQQNAQQRRQDDEERSRDERRAQQQAADPANSQACMQARRNLEEVQSTMGRGMYDEPARLSAAQRQLDQACLPPDQWAHAQRDRDQSNNYNSSYNGNYPYLVQPPYVVRPPRPPIVRPLPPPPPPPVFTNCNVFRCTDAHGNIYPR